VSRRKDGSYRYDGHWRRVRVQILERDRGLCQLRLEGCTVIADEVDHVIPISAGGGLYDPENCRAACRHCNRRRANLRRQQVKPWASREWPI
jgi:5-methylcytosine-specific restriction endonuclease McrA